MPSLQDMQRMLSEGMPVEYILGETTFCGLNLMVTQDVMIPKKSSEVLVQRALLCLHCGNDDNDDDGIKHDDNPQDIHDNDNSHREKDGKEMTGGRNDDICVLDIGTGSGCLLLSILHHYYLHSNADAGGSGGSSGISDGGGVDHWCEVSSESTKVVATKTQGRNRTITGVGIDLSSAALTIAHRNAQALKLDHVSSFVNMDFSDLILLMDEEVSNDVPSLSTGLSTMTIVSSATPTEPFMTNSNDNVIIQDNLVLPPTPPPPPPPTTTTTTTRKASTTTTAATTAPITATARKAHTTRIGRFDIIVCNPPYSSVREQRLSTTSREYEPAMALYASDKEGASGPLGAYRTLANAFMAVEYKYQQSLIHSADTSASSSLSPKLQHLFNTDARIIFEVGSGQDVQVQQIFSKCHGVLRFVGAQKDHKGIVRCLEYKYVTLK